MAQAFFEFCTPADLLKKLHRELDRLQKEFDLDHIFNFFVTAFSIRDWVGESREDLKEEICNLYSDEGPLWNCAVLGNKAKHLVLRQNDPNTLSWSGTLNGSPLNTVLLNGGPMRVLMSPTGGAHFDVWHYANYSVALLDQWFKDHGLE